MTEAFQMTELSGSIGDAPVFPILIVVSPPVIEDLVDHRGIAAHPSWKIQEDGESQLRSIIFDAVSAELPKAARGVRPVGF